MAHYFGPFQKITCSKVTDEMLQTCPDLEGSHVPRLIREGQTAGGMEIQMTQSPVESLFKAHLKISEIKWHGNTDATEYSGIPF